MRRRRPVGLPAPFVVAVVVFVAALAVAVPLVLAVVSAKAAQPEGCRLEITVSQRIDNRDELWVTVRNEGHRSEPVRVGFNRAAWVGVGNCRVEIIVSQSVIPGAVYLVPRGGGTDLNQEPYRLVLGKRDARRGVPLRDDALVLRAARVRHRRDGGRRPGERLRPVPRVAPPPCSDPRVDRRCDLQPLRRAVDAETRKWPAPFARRDRPARHPRHGSCATVKCRTLFRRMSERAEPRTFDPCPGGHASSGH